MSIDRFIEMWTHPDHPSETVTSEQFRTVESTFDFFYPADYKAEIERCGLPRPKIALLNAIAERELAISDVSNFLNPVEAAETTRDWQPIGLPRNLIAFATDCMGSLFCFNVDDLRSENVDRSPVWFFDHDFGTSEIVAPSFT